MDKRLENSLEENEKMSDEFKILAISCFGRIFSMLGHKNFERWINKKDLSQRIKQLIIEAMTEEEIEKNPTWLGYYTIGKNKIKVLDGDSNSDVEGTATHEAFHFITDISGKFCTFLNEGITEYLRGLARNGSKSYKINVETVKFLHEIFGDLIIKSYLTGSINEFNDKFENMISSTEDKESFFGSYMDIEKFYLNLNSYHKYVSARGKYFAKKRNGKCTNEELKKYEGTYKSKENEYLEVQSDVQKMFQRIIVGKITQMAKKFEFYKNGMLDLELASRTIQDMIALAPFRRFSKDIKLIEENIQQTIELSFQSVVENSHLLAYDCGNEKEEKKQRLLSKLVPPVMVTDKEVIITDTVIDKDDPEFVGNTESITADLIFMLQNDGSLSLQQYLEKLAILQDKMNISDEEMERILATHNDYILENAKDTEKISIEIIKAFSRIRKINQLQDQRERNTVKSTYRSIGNDCYIEQRDNQFFYIEIDENGEFIEQLLPYRNNIVFSGLVRRLDISCIDSISNIQVQKNGISINPGEELSFEEMKKIELENALTAHIREKIQSFKYMTIVDDAANPYEIEGIGYTTEVDERSRKIDFNQFISDIRDIIRFIDQERRDDIIDSITTELLDKVYGTTIERKKGENDVADCYEQIKRKIKLRVNSMQKDNNETIIQKLDENALVLNENRKTRVRNNASTAAVVFLSPEAQEKYMREKARNSAAVCFLDSQGEKTFFSTQQVMDLVSKSGIGTNTLVTLQKNIEKLTSSKITPKEEGEKPKDDNDQPNI